MNDKDSSLVPRYVHPNKFQNPENQRLEFPPNSISSYRNQNQITDAQGQNACYQNQYQNLNHRNQFASNPRIDEQEFPRSECIIDLSLSKFDNPEQVKATVENFFIDFVQNSTEQQ